MKNVLKMLASEWKYLVKAILTCAVICVIIIYTIVSVFHCFSGDNSNKNEVRECWNGTDTTQVDTIISDTVEVLTDSINEKD